MSVGAAERIEMGVDLAAAALFAAAMFVMWSAVLASPGGGAVAAVVAFLGCFAVLRAIAPAEKRLVLPNFAAVDFRPEQLPELLLTEADRLMAPAGEVNRSGEELVLDDILAEIGPNARVVRLFDPAAMPSPGQLKDRIDRHLHGASPPTAPPDASQALFDALAELRRSLR